MIESIQNYLNLTSKTLGSVLKVLLLSRFAGRREKIEKGKEIVILGNGPSLRTTIDKNLKWLKDKPKLAVNFAANTPDFIALKPEYYVMADSHFFVNSLADVNVARLWETLSEIDWQMVLYVPTKYESVAKRNLKSDNIRVKRFNLTPVEGFKHIRNMLYSSGLGMPRPRNVLIPSIMIAIREGFGKIYLAGADHNWSQSLWVDDENHVVNHQPHFYKDNSNEHKRVVEVCHSVRLHDLYNSFAVAFRSYFTVKDFSDRMGVEILNITPGSFIDAFPRMRPPEDNKI